MSKIESGKYTFWELIEKVGIKIPIIQRDYAQGRNTKKVKTIRENFLNKIYEVLEQEKSIDLDFVYGTIKNGFLIPLDGQQRLTTLFLLHYYLALKDGKLNDEAKRQLKKFTYETRLSSREFIELLIENKDEKISYENIKNAVENQTWFFSQWKNDPTIKSMLTMLDVIEEKFKDTKDFFEKLTNQELITFSFLDLDDFKLTDELYVKMNARGKPLSEFENFKSKFEIYLSDINVKANLDNEWYDIFWKIAIEKVNNSKDEKKPKYTEVSDKLFLNFFKNITAFYSEKFNEVDIFKFDYKTKVDEIVKVLDCLTSYKDSLIYGLRDYDDFKINIFEDFISIDTSKAEYEKRLRFYALMKFFIKIGKVEEDNEVLFKQWMRVCLNIIHNTIYNDIKDFNNIIKEIDSLMECLNGGESFLYKLSKDYKPIAKDKTDLRQLIDFEIKKAELIYKKAIDENELLKVEKDLYLDGYINFLILFSTKEDGFSKKLFMDYYEKFRLIWHIDEKLLVYQALLTQGNYLPEIGHNKYTFCSFENAIRTKKYHWYKVFDKKNDNELKKLLDIIDVNVDIQEILLKIIQDYKEKFNCEDTDDENKYLYTLISNSENIKYCKKLNISYIKPLNVQLIKKINRTTTAELYTWNLYKLYKEKLKLYCFKDMKYQEYDNPRIIIDNWEKDKHNFVIDIKFIDGKFYVEFFDRNEKINDIEQNLKDVLLKEENKFCEPAEDLPRYINNEFGLCQQNELINFLENLFIEFGKHNDPLKIPIQIVNKV